MSVLSCNLHGSAHTDIILSFAAINAFAIVHRQKLNDKAQTFNVHLRAQNKINCLLMLHYFGVKVNAF